MDFEDCGSNPWEKDINNRLESTVKSVILYSINEYSRKKMADTLNPMLAPPDRGSTTTSVATRGPQYLATITGS